MELLDFHSEPLQWHKKDLFICRISKNPLWTIRMKSAQMVSNLKFSPLLFTQVLNTRQDREVVSACLRNASGELSFLEEGVTAAMQLRGKQTGRPSCPNSRRTSSPQKIMGKRQTTNLSVRIHLPWEFQFIFQRPCACEKIRNTSAD